MNLKKEVRSLKIALGHDLYVDSFKQQDFRPPRDADAPKYWSKYSALADEWLKTHSALVRRVGDLARTALASDNPAEALLNGLKKDRGLRADLSSQVPPILFDSIRHSTKRSSRQLRAYLEALSALQK